jgi:hypothetical protein
MFQKATVRMFDGLRGPPGAPGVLERDGKGHEPGGVAERDGKGHGLVWARMVVTKKAIVPEKRTVFVGRTRIGK